MTRLRPFLKRLGGPDAITWPLFWATFASSVLSQFAIPQPYVHIALRIAGVFIAQAAMFLPLLLIRRQLVRQPTRPRPWLVLTGFAIATALRAGVLSAVLRGPDGAVTVPFTTRLTGSIGTAFFVMIATALVVSTSREQARDLGRLAEVQDQLRQAQAAAELQFTQENEAAVARVKETLAKELAALGRASDDAEPARVLHRLASDVVRPLSHELAQSVPTWTPATEPISDWRVNWRQVLVDFSVRGPFRPMLTAVTMTLLMTAPSAIYLRPHTAEFLVTLLVSTPLVFWGANRILRRRSADVGAHGAVTVTMLVAVGAAAVPAVLVGCIIGGTTGLVLALGGGAFLAGIAILIGLVSSVFATQRSTSDELQSSIRALRISLVRIRQAQWFHQRTLARALHGELQSAVVAASFRIQAAHEEGVVTPALLDEVRAELARAIDVLGTSSHQPLSLEAFVDQLTKVWSRVADIKVDAVADAQAALERDPILRAMVMELTTEAVSNAIRHGHAESIAVSLACRPNADEVALRVASDGETGQGRGRGGLGSRLLDDCTLTWEETAAHGRRVLTAVLPR